ncbi:response regulator [Amycolatopsis sp. CA-230715]|uniref:response regulator n=1 Tax=Amycolatopsis sp. CA-230715 TaxID=2745196 RepID=UPI001C0218EE|nr:response regulator transcription factor [Amycolatopsis sp. CA-230715]QWF78541.1 Transcriptional regulatory protein LiaR [Amycolatopsis sp. CA-230715]
MSTRKGPIRVLLVDDDALVRTGLRTILSSGDDIEVVGEASDGSEAVGAATRYRADVVLIDIRMPDMDGITATGKLRELPDPPHVLVLTTFRVDSYVFGALKAGASGFLLKDTPPLEIVQAVRSVSAGDAMLSPAVTRTLIQHFTETETRDERQVAESALKELSAREREVAIEIGRGLSNAEIAGKLYMSEATVKAHVSRLLTKLNVNNRVQIAILVHGVQPS